MPKVEGSGEVGVVPLSLFMDGGPGEQCSSRSHWEGSQNIPSQPVFAARLKPQCLAMTSLTQSAWNKRTMHSGLEEFSLFERIIVLIGQ